MEDRANLSRALAEQQRLIHGLSQLSYKCFMQCTGKPSKALSSSEQSCLTNCVDRYRDITTFLIERLSAIAEKEKEKGGMTLG